ncbi:AAA domain-containing protein [Natronoarchaeum philippinense]|uniref:AAA domain-containing protein n=1 Tax=Natronoarchaeum philippinense TaxID=558529 RepID=A0A285NZB7_NATPI|nr:AAA family ATPase [Natronoarchaeum philippinense]SNZ14834.1 AAA domain-containing protein [Natronoarchaeum philippinense]
MTEQPTTAAITGTAGGAGTTRLSVEAGATLARAGYSVALVDVAFATQGLAQYVSGRIDEDVVDLVTGDDPRPSDAAVDLGIDADGRLVAVPSQASFQALARAKTAGAAERFEAVLDRLDDAVDRVLVDVPPVATNPAVAAVTTADRVALVAPGTDRGVDSLQRSRARLTDVGTTDDLAVANRVDELPDGSIDLAIPESDATAVADAPATVDPDDEFAPAVAAFAEALFDEQLDLEFPEPDLVDRLRP